jgi:long-chain-acyl-CoA dehydrogenase
MPLPRTVFDDDHRLFRESAAAFVDRDVLPRREFIGRDLGLGDVRA